MIALNSSAIATVDHMTGAAHIATTTERELSVRTPTDKLLNGTVALSDRKRTTPQVFRPGDGRRTHCANTTPSSDGPDGRLSAQCDSQPDDKGGPGQMDFQA